MSRQIPALSSAAAVGGLFFAAFVAPFAYFFLVSFWIVNFFALTPAPTLRTIARSTSNTCRSRLYTLTMSATIGI